MEIKRETSDQKLLRKTKNAWIRTLGFCRRSHVCAEKRVAKTRIQGRKKEFGIQYMGILEQGGSTEELSECLCQAQEEITGLQEKIKTLDQKADKIHSRVLEKLISNPNKKVSPSPMGGVSSPPPPTYEVVTGMHNDNTNPAVSEESERAPTTTTGGVEEEHPHAADVDETPTTNNNPPPPPSAPVEP